MKITVEKIFVKFLDKIVNKKGISENYFHLSYQEIVQYIQLGSITGNGDHTESPQRIILDQLLK